MEKWSDKFELNGMHLREKKELKSFTRISARPLTFSLRLSDLSIIPHNRFRRKKRDYYPPPWNLRRTCPSPSTIHDSRASRKRNKIGLSTVSRSNRTFEQETRSDSRRRTPTTLLLWNFLDRYCIIIGESVARSSSSPSRAGRAWKLSYPTTFGKKHRQKHGRYRVKSAIVGNEGIRFLLLR